MFMAGSSLFALIDDIATILDDVSVMTRVAAKKTAGVIGDDLALNAQRVTGVAANRELPVVWSVAKGSAINKAILVPSALLISAVAGWAITPLLMVGGSFLCYEGFEKISHSFLSKHGSGGSKGSGGSHGEAVDDGPAQTQTQIAVQAEQVADDLPEVVNEDQTVEMETDNLADEASLTEKEKIKGAVRTDFILSAEILVISLGAVAASTFLVQASVLVAIAVLMTVGVYGVVAGIVKLDDLGYFLLSRSGESRKARVQRWFGRGILRACPWLMKTLSVVGTLAMFLVGGGIILHGIAPAYQLAQNVTTSLAGLPVMGGVLAFLSARLAELLVGLAAGALVLLLVTGGKKILASVLEKNQKDQKIQKTQ
jgi:predicted DNA repair protein MutK